MSNQQTFINFFYQILSFFSTGFRYAELFVIKSLFVFFLLGLFFSLIIFKTLMLPSLLFFFITLPTNYNVTSPYPFLFEAKLTQFIEFSINTYLTCLFFFEFCMMTLLFIVYNNINTLQIQRSRKSIYVTITASSLVITPPDLFSQIFIFFLILLSCEFIILINCLRLKIYNFILTNQHH